MKLNQLSNGEIKRRPNGNHPDGANLYLRVHGNSRTWSFRYARHGKTYWLTLGSALDMTLAEARRRARAFRQELNEGVDLAARVKAARAPKEPGMTFAAAAESYIEANKAGWSNPKHVQQWRRTVELDAAALLAKPVAEINTDHVLAVLQPIWTTKTETASRLRGRIEAVLDYAAARKWRSGENPARWKGHLDCVLPKRSKVAPIVHQPALPWKSLPGACTRLKASGSTSSLCTLFIALCATRSAEARGASWAEVDLKARVWVVPAERMKARKPHRVALSDAAMMVLAEMGKRHGTGGLVFPGGRSIHKPLSDVAVSKALHAAAGTTAVTVHGLRSSFRDWCGETGVASDLAETALAHTNKDKVEAAYARSDLLEQRRPLMQAWGRFCIPET